MKKRFPITDEVRVLKYMRLQAGLSLKGAGQRLSMTDGAISHLETGKMRLPLARIEQMVAAYGFTMNDFFKLSRARHLPNSHHEECLRLFKSVPMSRIEEVLTFLKSLRKQEVEL